MKYIVEIQLSPGMKAKVVESFEERGPNRNPHIQFVGAWVGLHADIFFLLVESDAESHVTDACRAWADLGPSKLYPVVDIEQY